MVKKTALEPTREETVEGHPDPRRRDRKSTLSELDAALQRLQTRGEKITLAAVSKEAGVSPALMHNRYPDFAERVRAVIGKGLRKQRDDKANELSQAKDRIKELNDLVATLREEIVRLASVNEMQFKEMAILKAIADGKVTRGQFGRKPSETDPLNGPPNPENR